MARWPAHSALCLGAVLACSWMLLATAAAPKTCPAGASCSVVEADDDAAAEPLPSPDPEAVARVERLLAWVEENYNVTGLRGPDATFTVVISGDTTEVKDPENPDRKARPSYGLAAKRDFKQGEMVLNFPPEMLIRADKLLQASRDPDDPDHPPLFNTTEPEEEEEVSGWAPMVAIAAFLLREKAKGEESFWAPFLDVLPEHVALPMFWSDDFVAALEYEPAQSLLEGYEAGFIYNWERINPAAVANTSKAEFYWALSLACSRLFDASKPTRSNIALYMDPAGYEGPGDGQEGGEAPFELQAGSTVAMLPVAEFINHATANNLEWIVDHREGRGKKLLEVGQSAMPALERAISLRFSTTKDVSAGTELTTAYGMPNNEHLLASYSFVLSPNVFDDFLVARGPLGVLYLLRQVQKRRGEKNQNRHVETKEMVEDDPLELERSLLPDFPASPFWSNSGLTPEKVITRSNRAVLDYKATYAERWQLRTEPKYDAVGELGSSEDKGDEEALQQLRYALWGEGDMDPRLLVAFTALRYVELFSQEPSYEALALAAVPFAWGLGESGCHSYAHNTTHEELQVMREAAADLMTGLQILSEGFSTTFDQDRSALLELRECQKLQFRNESGRKVEGLEVECSDLERHQREWEMILLFRLGKKGIISNARQRLQDRCIHPKS